MDLELHPSITLHDRAWHILVAPLPMLIAALNRHLELQRFEVLFVCGNCSRVLSSLDRRFTTLQIRRAFTVFQLMTVLEDSHHSLLIIEHDPSPLSGCRGDGLVCLPGHEGGGQGVHGSSLLPGIRPISRGDDRLCG